MKAFEGCPILYFVFVVVVVVVVAVAIYSLKEIFYFIYYLFAGS